MVSREEARSRRHPKETIVDANYADDQALLTNTPAQDKSRLHNLEQADKIELTYFNQDGTISSLNCKPLK